MAQNPSGSQWITNDKQGIFTFKEQGDHLKPPAHFKLVCPFYVYNGPWSEFNFPEFNEEGCRYFAPQEIAAGLSPKIWRVISVWKIDRRRLPSRGKKPKKPTLYPLTDVSWWSEKRKARFPFRWGEVLIEWRQVKAANAALIREYNRALAASERNTPNEFDRMKVALVKGL